MREIKFRAWDKGNKEMLEVQQLDYDCCYNSKPLIRTTKYNDYFDEEDMILMQYVGIKDKNGKEVYEGDIVYMRCDGISGFGEVIFENGCFWIDDKKRKRTYPLYNEGVYRVDGNIFENPELLGDE